MISIIISSVHPKLLQDVKSNIADTIGVPYEIISYENANGAKGLCEIYNVGAKQAKYEILCFMHEDLKICSKDWGLLVIDTFKNNDNLGVLGVAGSAYKTFAPYGWGIGNEGNTEAYNYLQRFKDPNKPVIHAYLNKSNVQLQEVVTVDGMWFCTTKNLALSICFDEGLFKGFHCYDLDYCLAVGQSHQVMVTFDVLMEHFSEGGYNKDWYLETLKLHQKWENKLPACCIQLPQKIKDKIEKKAYILLFNRLVNLGYSQSDIQQLLESYRKKAKMNLWFYLKLRFKLIKILKGIS